MPSRRYLGEYRKTAWGQAGVFLEHSSYVQMNEETVHISRSQLQPGDIVFFFGGGHEGLYIGNGNVIQAPHTGDVVRISSINWIGGAFTSCQVMPLFVLTASAEAPPSIFRLVMTLAPSIL